MKRNIIILAIVIAIIAGAVGVGWLYFRSNPAAWDDFLAEMEGDASSAPQPVKRPARTGEGLVASGSIEAEEITIAAEIGGRVVELAADEGQEVMADDVLLQLDREALLAQREGAEAAVAQTEAAVEAARAGLAMALAGATAEELAAAEGAVLAAQGGVAAAEAALVQAEINADIGRVTQQAQSAVDMAAAALAQAEGMLAAAEADLARAEAELARLLAGARPQESAMLEAQVAQVEAELWFPTHIHDELIRNEILGTPEEEARYQMLAVQAARDAAQAQLDLAKAGPTVDEIAGGRAGVSAAEAQVLIYQAGVEAAEAALAQAEAALVTAEGQVTLAEAGVNTARTQVEIAEGQLAQAVATRDRLQAGATGEEIDMLEAQVAQAEATLAVAQAALKTLDIQLARTTLAAPVGGIILQRLIHLGELAAPGAPLFTLADLDQVTLTVYVPEAELDKVSLGQTVEVTVDAYEEVFVGQVSKIASQAEFTPKNVQTQEERVHMVFAVKVLLENADHRLKAGMPADAIFLE
jgi:multidrug resistance efflux pump